MADIFLSYSRKDVKAADRIQHYLEARGLTVFRDIEMGPGENWVKKTGEMLRSTRLVLVIWSRNSATSDNVSHEAMIGKELGKLVPAMIDDVQGMDLPMGLSVVQSADVQDWRDPASKGLERLAAAIEQHLKAPLKPAPKRKAQSPVPRLLAGLVVGAVIGAGAYVFLTGKPPASASPLATPILTMEARDAVDIETPAPGGDDRVADPTMVIEQVYDLQSLPQEVQAVVMLARGNEAKAISSAAQAEAAANEALRQQAAAKSGTAGTEERQVGVNLIAGQLSAGRFDGHAVVTVEEGAFKGDAYLGQMKNGLNQGAGVYVYSRDNPNWKSTRYGGDWKDGTMNGFGAIVFRDGGTYTGEFLAGKMSGAGVYRDATVLYEGQYKGGKKHGIGVRFRPGESRLEAGRWDEGRFLGPVIP